MMSNVATIELTNPATALEWVDEEVVAISSHVDLLTVCRALGLATANTNQTA